MQVVLHVNKKHFIILTVSKPDSLHSPFISVCSDDKLYKVLVVHLLSGASPAVEKCTDKGCLPLSLLELLAFNMTFIFIASVLVLIEVRRLRYT